MHSWQGRCSLAYEEEFDIGVSDEDEEKLLTVQDFFDHAHAALDNRGVTSPEF
ncbi:MULTISPECIES: hypothetical protein [Streptomyces]|uniref:hypothetical protein n=1 Tax=Streptomyces TaxID=1883 RepID=UPI0013159B99|nr:MULTISPECIES: hypothetical protein [Streptomyces]